MRESDKGMKGDHRNISDPTADRKDFIKHVAENAAKDEKKESKDNGFDNKESKNTGFENKDPKKPNNQKH